jgi:hypothetical protein
VGGSAVDMIASERIAELEAEVADLKKKLERAENRLELQQRVTNKNSTAALSNAVRAASAAEMETALRRGEREKELEVQYLKVKADKDKALKLLIQLIGKERLQKHIQTHAGSPDLLDSIITTFGSGSHRAAHPDADPPSTPMNEK